MATTEDSPAPTPEESTFFRALNEQIAQLVHPVPAIGGDRPQFRALGVLQGLMRSTLYCRN
jgi:hypothetical protein